MKKFIRRFFRVLGVFLLLIIAAAIIIPIVFKDQIAAKVKEEANKNINAKLDFADYGLSLFRNFPNFSLRMDKLSLVGIKEFEKDTLASMESLYASIDLMSVFKGDQYEITSIKLDKPKILLKILPNGKANWDIAKPSEPTEPEKEPKAEEPSALKIGLKQLKISQANITFDDQSGNTNVQVTNLNHTLSGDFTDDFTTLRTETNIESLTVAMSGVNYLNNAKLSVDADIDADLKNSKYTFKDNEINLNALLFAFEGYVAMLEDGMDLDLKFNAAKSEFKSFLSLIPAVYSKDFESIQTDGKLGFDGFAKGKYTEKALPAFALNIYIENAMFKYPDLPKSVTEININTSIKNSGGDPNNTVIDVKKFHLNMGGNPVDMKVLVTTPVSDPNIDGSVKGKLNLAEINQFYPLEKDEQLNGTIILDLIMKGKMSSIENEKYEEFKADGKVEITNLKYKSKDFAQGVQIKQASMKASPQFFELIRFDAKIGKSDINANGRIDNILSYVFKDELLTGNFNVNAGVLNLNEFMSASSEESSTEATSTEENSSMSIIEVPGNIDFKLTTNLKKVIYNKLEMSNVLGIVEIRDHAVNLQNLSFNALNGKMVLGGSYSTKDPKVPSIDFNMDIQNFDIQKTFKTFVAVQKIAPIAEKTKGSFSTRMKYMTKLDAQMMPITETMAGQGYFESSRIVVEGYKPMVVLSEKLKMEKLKTLTLQSFHFNFQFAEGKVTVEPFDMGYNDMKAQFGGSSMLDGGIDYLMNMEIPRKNFGSQVNSAIDGLVSEAKGKGFDINPGEIVFVNAKMLGSVDNPDIKLSVSSSNEGMMDNLKDQAKEELNKQKEELENKAKDEADKLKKEAEQKKKEAEQKAKAEADKKKKELEKKAQEEKKKQEEELKKKLKNKFKP